MVLMLFGLCEQQVGELFAVGTFQCIKGAERAENVREEKRLTGKH